MSDLAEFTITPEVAAMLAPPLAPAATLRIDGRDLGQVSIPDLPVVSTARARLAAEVAVEAERSFASARPLVRELLGAGNLSGAATAFATWQSAHAGPLPAEAAELDGLIRWLSSVDDVLAGTGATLSDRPSRLFVRTDIVRPRARPEDRAPWAPRSQSWLLPFGRPIDVRAAAPGGWLLVSDASTGEHGLLALAGWIRDEEAVSRGGLALEERRRAAERRRREVVDRRGIAEERRSAATVSFCDLFARLICTGDESVDEIRRCIQLVSQDAGVRRECGVLIRSDCAECALQRAASRPRVCNQPPALLRSGERITGTRHLPRACNRGDLDLSALVDRLGSLDAAMAASLRWDASQDARICDECGVGMPVTTEAGEFCHVPAPRCLAEAH